LITAASVAGDNQYVYVAGGTYTGTTDPMLTVNKSVRLTGGWDGAGSGPVIVDSMANPTILDGEDTRRVIEVVDLAQPVISGFTIKRGYHTERGGGMYIDNTIYLEIQDTFFYDNYSGAYGGGLYIANGTIEITSCRFEANEAVYGGGALMLGNDSNATIARNTFTGNTASYGSAINADKASVMFYNNYVLKNLGTTQTSAILLSSGAGHEANFYNNIIAGNIGEGIRVQGYTLNLYHNTIADNYGFYGLWVLNDAHVVIINNIFSGHDRPGRYSIYLSAGGVIDSSTNNLFWNNTSDSHTGTSPVTGDPKFTGMYHLLPGSAARDSGTSTFIHWDIDQESRPKGDAPDIGADESSFSSLAPILLPLLD
jgi:hypothetical protein